MWQQQMGFFLLSGNRSTQALHPKNVNASKRISFYWWLSFPGHSRPQYEYRSSAKQRLKHHIYSLPIRQRHHGPLRWSQALRPYCSVMDTFTNTGEGVLSTYAVTPTTQSRVDLTNDTSHCCKAWRTKLCMRVFTPNYVLHLIQPITRTPFTSR